MVITNGHYTLIKANRLVTCPLCLLLNCHSMAEEEERSNGGLLVSSKAELKRKEQQRKKSKSGGFESLNLSYNVYRAIKRIGYKVPTPIQRKTMPLVLYGADVVAMARTGSGKTAAFLVPLLHKLQHHLPQAGIRALILSPTRDLALQTLKFTNDLARYTDLRASLLVGGDSMESQFEELAQNPDIVIATPGRLMHHLSEVDDMSLRTVQFLIVDEADTLFGMGFAQQLHIILTQLSENRQTLLFSATMPSALAEFAKAGLHDPQIVRLDVDMKINPNCELIFLTLRPEEKYAALVYLIREQIGPSKKVLIFVSTSYHTEFLKSLLGHEGITSGTCYSGMDSEARKSNMAKFRSGKIKVLIVTDIACRGIDIRWLDFVINWDFPSNPKLFVHRVGRVARDGQTGTAYSFVTSEDMPYLLDLHLFLSRGIKPAPTEEDLLKHMTCVMDKNNQATANGMIVYGRFPQTVLDLVQDRLRDVIDSSANLQSLQKTCINASRVYSRLKPFPSKKSIQRVKDLPREGLHPMFKDELKSNELTAFAFAERLKSFRPKRTILEAEGHNAMSKHSQGPKCQWVDVMKKKRAIHEMIINQVHQKCSSDQVAKDEVEQEDSIRTKRNNETLKSNGKPKSFREEDYYISSVPSNKHSEAGLSMQAVQGFGSNRLDSAVMDLVAEDREGMQKQKRVYHWDKKSKKYIKLNNGERVTVAGKVKTEGGKKVKAQKTGIYKKWKASTHNRIALKGTDIEGLGSSVGLAGGRFDRRFKGRNQQRAIPNAHVPSEIKDLEQIRKERQRKTLQASMKKANWIGKNMKKRKGK